MKLFLLLLLIAPCFGQSTELIIEHRGKEVRISCTNGGVVVFKEWIRDSTGVELRTCRPGSSPCEQERDGSVLGAYAETPVTAYCQSRADLLAEEADADYCNERHPFGATDQGTYRAAVTDCLKARRTQREKIH